MKRSYAECDYKNMCLFNRQPGPTTQPTGSLALSIFSDTDRLAIQAPHHVSQAPSRRKSVAVYTRKKFKTPETPMLTKEKRKGILMNIRDCFSCAIDAPLGSLYAKRLAPIKKCTLSNPQSQRYRLSSLNTPSVRGIEVFPHSYSP